MAQSIHKKSINIPYYIVFCYGKYMNFKISNIWLINRVKIICSGKWKWVHSPRHNIQEHGRSRKPPSSSSSIKCRSLSILSLWLRRIPRHLIRPLTTSILQRMLHLRHSRFHLRKRSCGSSKLYDLCSKTNERSKEHSHCPRSNWPKSKHWHFDS